MNSLLISIYFRRPDYALSHKYFNLLFQGSEASLINTSQERRRASLLLVKQSSDFLIW